MKIEIALIFTFVLSLPLVAHSEDMNIDGLNPKIKARMSDIQESEVDFHEMIDRTAEVYSAIVKGSHGEVPLSVLQDAKCIAILPKVLTGALVFGGTHGTGLASCKNGETSWSQPVAVSLNKASIGLQAGVKSTDLVLFFKTAKSATALKGNEFALGTDVSAVAGTFDSEIDRSSNAGVIVYSRTKGAFAGVSMNAGILKGHKEKLENYYDEKVDYKSILEGQETPDKSKYSEKLTALFP